jgi:hypothetical protein
MTDVREWWSAEPRGERGGQIIYVDQDYATTPENGECIARRWWIVHPEKGIAFYYNNRFGYDPFEGPAAQCNQSESTTRALMNRMGGWWEGHEVRYFEAVFMGHACKAVAEFRKKK